MYRDTSQALDEHDRAVGALLIGEALIDDCDRAAVRARGGAAADAHARWRAIADVHDTYPEIWRYLDRARRVLATRGANTAAYDELRPHAARAATDSESEGESLDTRALEEARRALEQLKLAVPGADWDAIAARTEGLARSPLARRRRQRAALAGVIGVCAFVFVGWLIAIVPEHKQSQREVMRGELHVVEQQRKLKIATLTGALDQRCAPAEAHELVRLLVQDGRGGDARTFADDYTGRCGEDPVIDHWAHAPRPGH